MVLQEEPDFPKSEESENEVLEERPSEVIEIEDIGAVVRVTSETKKLYKRVTIKQDESEVSSEQEFEESEDEEEEEDEEAKEVRDLYPVSSKLSEISFIWEDEIYKFEELCDPGNIENIYRQKPSRSDYFDQSGVERYTAMCKSLNIVPMTRLLKSLRTDEIDLSHRNVVGKNIRAMCAALEVNNLVSRLILRYNRLTPADCSFIGYVLLYNENILLLDLSGCRIGPIGVKLLIEFLEKNLGLVELNLSKCNIQDEGMKALGFVLMKNNAIKKLDLSYNNLAEESGEALGMALKTNTCITDLNLAYNNLFDPVAMKPFYNSLAKNLYVVRLNLSWNGLNGVEMGANIGKFLKKNHTIQFLDLSDNRLEGMAVIEIKKAIPKAKSLETLKMGKNPMSPEDLESLLNGVKANPNLKVLDLEDLWVKKSFLKIVNKISQDREFEVRYGGVFSNYEVFGPDYPALILKRAQYEAQKPKREKLKKDFGHLLWSLGDEPLAQNAFMDLVKKFKAKINKQLFPELLKQFTMPKTQLIDVVAMREKYLSLFPDSTPPPPKKKKQSSREERKKEKAKGKKKKQVAEEGAEGTEEGELELEAEYDEGFEELSSEVAEGFLPVGSPEEEPQVKEENKGRDVEEQSKGGQEKREGEA